MLLEEFDAQYMHVKGTDNVVADGISRLQPPERAIGPGLLPRFNACALIKLMKRVENAVRPSVDRVT